MLRACMCLRACVCVCLCVCAVCFVLCKCKLYAYTSHRLLQPYDDSYGPEAELKKQIHSSFNSPLALRRNSLLSPLPLSLKAPSFTPVITTQSQSFTWVVEEGGTRAHGATPGQIATIPREWLPE